MKKLFRHIRHRICRTIYYADQCPMDNRRNYRAIAEMAIKIAVMYFIGFIIMFVFVLMA